MVKKKYFVLGQLEQPRQDKNWLYRHDKPNEPAKEGPLSFELFELPFTSIQQSQGATTLYSLSSHRQLLSKVSGPGSEKASYNFNF